MLLSDWDCKESGGEGGIRLLPTWLNFTESARSRRSTGKIATYSILYSVYLCSYSLSCRLIILQKWYHWYHTPSPWKEMSLGKAGVRLNILAVLVRARS